MGPPARLGAGQPAQQEAMLAVAPGRAFVDPEQRGAAVGDEEAALDLCRCANAHEIERQPRLLLAFHGGRDQVGHAASCVGTVPEQVPEAFIGLAVHALAARHGQFRQAE